MPTKQSGAVLIVALIILIVLTIIGVGVMESSVISERMAGNALNNQRVFQAAESALRQAEEEIAGFTQRPIATTATTVKPLGTPVAGVYSWWRNGSINTSWWTNNAEATAGIGGTFPGINTAPRYYIEEYNAVCDTLTAPQEQDCVFVYRVTAIAWGGRNTTVTLQSLYSRRF